MNKPLSCGTQDMLEAAIIQKRRLDLSCRTEEQSVQHYTRVLPVDINTIEGTEWLTFLTTDNQGGILKLIIATADILTFEAIDFADPRIHYQANKAKP